MSAEVSNMVQLYPQPSLFEEHEDTWRTPECASDREYAGYEGEAWYRIVVDQDMLRSRPWLLGEPTFIDDTRAALADLLSSYQPMHHNQAFAAARYMAEVGVDGAQDMMLEIARVDLEQGVGAFQAMFAAMAHGEQGDFEEADVQGFRFKYLVIQGCKYQLYWDTLPQGVSPYMPDFSRVLHQFALHWPDSVRFEMQTRYHGTDLSTAGSARWLKDEERQELIEDNFTLFQQEIASRDRGQVENAAARIDFGARTRLFSSADMDRFVEFAMASDANPGQFCDNLSSIAEQSTYFIRLSDYLVAAVERGGISDRSARSILHFAPQKENDLYNSAAATWSN